MSWPLPGMAVASTNRMSPPTGVQARPVATPAVLVRAATSDSNLRAPRISRTAAASIVTCVAEPSEIRTAAFRSTAPISRSRFRTPASRV